MRFRSLLGWTHGLSAKMKWQLFASSYQALIGMGIGNVLPVSPIISLEVLDGYSLTWSASLTLTAPDSPTCSGGRSTMHDLQLQKRAVEALDYYVGDTRWIHLNLRQISEEIELALSA
jgi:hypothetical protein